MFVVSLTVHTVLYVALHFEYSMPIAYSTVLYLIFVWLDVSLEVRGVGDGGMVIGHTILIPPGLDGWAGSA